MKKPESLRKKVPVVISETHEETKNVFIKKAQEMSAPITFADENWKAYKESEEEGKTSYTIQTNGELKWSVKTQTTADGDKTLDSKVRFNRFVNTQTGALQGFFST